MNTAQNAEHTNMIQTLAKSIVDAAKRARSSEFTVEDDGFLPHALSLYDRSNAFCGGVSIPKGWAGQWRDLHDAFAADEYEVEMLTCCFGCRDVGLRVKESQAE